MKCVSIDLPEKYPINLLLTAKDVEMLQFICEIVEQFGIDDEDFIRQYCFGGEPVSDRDVEEMKTRLTWFGDAWSFNLRRTLEQEIARYKENDLPNPERGTA